jgi:hypothetical protein
LKKSGGCGTNQNVRSALHITELWALAFLTLCAALVLLNIFFALIENDLALLSVGKETAIAAVAALIEGASVWVVATFLPPNGPFIAARLFIPALIVGIIYKAAHLEDWSRYEIFALLLFQLIIAAFGGCLFLGQFTTAFVILFVFAVCVAFTVVFMRGL